MELRKIDENNIWNIIKLCVNDKQASFVATNTQSLLEAYVTVTSGKVALPFGLFESDNLVGFVMFGYGSSGEEGEPLVATNNYCIWQFMIDKAFQGKDLGKKGMQAALDYWIKPPFYCDLGYNIYLGKNVMLNYDCVILDVCPVVIGESTLIGPGTHIYTACHSLDPEERKNNIEYGKPVTIGKNVWIGGHCSILPGITIGDNAVIGAGSVVTKDIPANTVAVGNPCKVVREINSK